MVGLLSVLHLAGLRPAQVCTTVLTRLLLALLGLPSHLVNYLPACLTACCYAVLCCAQRNGCRSLSSREMPKSTLAAAGTAAETSASNSPGMQRISRWASMK